ncbi:MAG: nuclear transport factor 2 family protein [Cyclobacteriaceae bacterium]
MSIKIHGRGLIRCFLVLLLTSAVLSIRAQDGISSAEELILELRKESNLAIKNHQVADILKFLTDDVNITASNQQVFPSKQEYQNAWINAFSNYPDLYFVRKTKEIQLHNDGESAWEQGTWKALGPTDLDWKSYGGNYSALWVKVAGDWKIKSQLFVKLY